MKDITELRRNIDDIDDKIAELYLKRMELCGKIGEEKAKEGAAVTNALREKEIVNRLTAKADDEMKIYLKQLYSTIFFQSKAYQNKFAPTTSPVAEQLRKIKTEQTPDFPVSATVACQGVAGAYSGTAAEKLFEISDITYLSSFDAVFNAVEKGLCEFGVLPIENSLAGSVSQVYDLMKKHNFYIVKSVRMQISHVVASVRGATVDGIRKVYSHAQALAQCGEFLKRHNVQVSEEVNTAVAAQKVADLRDPSVAVLCSEDCASLYGLHVLERGVQDNADNFTRFICISKKLQVFAGADKISVMTGLSNKPGSLNRTLSRFATLGLNLTKLESRPIGSQFEFMFYFDFEGNVFADNVLDLIAEMDNTSDKFVFLGSYKEVL